jgi:hypothetical protein
MQGKKSFVLYADLMEIVYELSDEEAGKLIKMIVDYVNDKDPTTDDRIISLSFKPIKNSLKADLKKWENIKDKRSEFGRLGGLAKASKSKQKPPDAKQNLAKLPVSVNVNVNVINIESHNKIFKGIWESEAWIESQCMRWKCDKDELKNHLHLFRQECIDKDQIKVDEKDAKSHFINWIKKGNPIESKTTNQSIVLEARKINRNPQ